MSHDLQTALCGLFLAALYVVELLRAWGVT